MLFYQYTSYIVFFFFFTIRNRKVNFLSICVVNLEKVAREGIEEEKYLIGGEVPLKYLDFIL